jgi:hypothetical protein
MELRKYIYRRSRFFVEEEENIYKHVNRAVLATTGPVCFRRRSFFNEPRVARLRLSAPKKEKKKKKERKKERYRLFESPELIEVPHVPTSLAAMQQLVTEKTGTVDVPDRATIFGWQVGHAKSPLFSP